MKRYLFFAILLVAIFSCSKNDDSKDDNNKGEITIFDENTFDMVIKNIYNSPVKNLTNIQVSDYIPYTLEITDTQDNASAYSLILVKEGEKNHQTLGKDYEIYIENEKGEKQKMEVLKNDKTNYVLFEKKGKYHFFIKPLIPGTFKHVYELQKQVDGKPVGNHIKQEVLFNAVQIKVWVTVEGARRYGFYNKYTMKFYLKIDDGKDQDDAYLTSNEHMTQRYLITYDGKDYTGTFDQGEHNFFTSEKRGFYTKLENRFVDKIFITQTKANQRQDILEYYNIGEITEEIID